MAERFAVLAVVELVGVELALAAPEAEDALLVLIEFVLDADADLAAELLEVAAVDGVEAVW